MGRDFDWPSKIAYVVSVAWFPTRDKYAELQSIVKFGLDSYSIMFAILNTLVTLKKETLQLGISFHDELAASFWSESPACLTSYFFSSISTELIITRAHSLLLLED